MHHFLLRLYGIILCILFGIITAAGLVSFGSVYQPLPVLIATFVTTSIALYFYFRHDNGWFAAVFPAQVHPQSRLFWSAIGVALVLLISVFLFRLVNYPLSAAGNVIPGDAISYHFLKAMELIRTGTLWNVAHLYGEYPIGYESLIAFGLLFTGSWQFAGIIHSLILLLLILSIYLLLRRYTHLPDALLFLISVALFFYPDLYSQALIVGKNDLFLAATILGAILHSPLALRGQSNACHPLGLALLTSMSMATKPGGIWILAFLWLLVVIYWGQAYRAGKAQQYLDIRHFVLAIGLMFPGGLWVIRNYSLMGRFFSPEVSSFFAGSIFANLANLRLYTSGLESYALIGLSLWIFALVIFLALFVPLPLTLLLIVMIGAFMITPLSAFHTTAQVTVHIEWRYTTHLFFILLILVIARFETLLKKFVTFAMQHQRIFTAMLITGCCGILAILNPTELLALNPDNALKLRDPYSETVGVNGYHSVYDYVQHEIQNAVIFSHGAEPFYLYNPTQPTNQIIGHTRHPLGMPDLIALPEPDFLVYIPENLPGEARDPFIFVSDYAWELVYEDSRGAVYQRSLAD